MKKEEEWINKIHTGDAVEVLRDMPSDFIHSVMFSPPYWGQRNYDADGQIGVEETLDEYIKNLATLTDELKRVLRPDGNMWINLGDCYGPQKQPGDVIPAKHNTELESDYSDFTEQYQQKCKVMLPSRVALELIERGWILRNDVVWNKTNPIPQSPSDKLSNTFEKVFHFTLQPDYFYNLDNIRIPHKTDLDEEPPIGGHKHQDNINRTYSGRTPSRNKKGKNPGDVVTLATGTSDSQHLAVYPEELTEIPIKSTVPLKVCQDCRTPYVLKDSYEKQCECETEVTEPGIILDPMAGEGTTCRAAVEHGRNYIGIELNPEFAEIARENIPDTKQQKLNSFN